MHPLVALSVTLVAFTSCGNSSGRPSVSEPASARPLADSSAAIGSGKSVAATPQQLPAEEREAQVASSSSDTCQQDQTSSECRCEAGDNDVCIELADDSFQSGDFDAAILRTLVLCRKEVSEACFRAKSYMEQLSIDRRFGSSAADLGARGLRLSRENCAQGEPRACFDYGRFLLAGKYVSANAVRGQEVLEISCAAGHARACSFLAHALESGAGDLQRDMLRAQGFLERACEAGEAGSCTMVGDRVIKRDPSRARELYVVACRGDHTPGCERKGQLEAKLGNFDEAYASHTKACELDSSTACVEAGALAEAGKTSNEGPEKARELYQTACENEDPEGCAALASLWGKGLGGARDWGLSVELFEKACAQGSKRACRDATRARRNPPDWRCTTEADCKALCAERVGKSCTQLGVMLAEHKAEAYLRDPAGNDMPLYFEAASCAESRQAFELGCEYSDKQACLWADSVGSIAAACRLGHKASCYEVEAAGYEDADERDQTAILRSLRRSCKKRGGESACVALARVDDSPSTESLLERACQRGHARSCFVLADLLDDGIGIGFGTCCNDHSKEELELRRQLGARLKKSVARLEQACRLGHAPACYERLQDGGSAAVEAEMRALGDALLETQSCQRWQR